MLLKKHPFTFSAGASGWSEYDGKFGLLPESFPIIAYKRMYIHSLLFFTKDN